MQLEAWAKYVAPTVVALGVGCDSPTTTPDDALEEPFREEPNPAPSREDLERAWEAMHRSCFGLPLYGVGVIVSSAITTEDPDPYGILRPPEPGEIEQLWRRRTRSKSGRDC